MKHYIFYTRKKSSREQGVALLMALGILSLLLVMALAFATNAILARQSAANSRNRSQAIFLAKSTANKLMATMRHMATRTTNPRTDFDLLVSQTYMNDDSNGDKSAAPNTLVQDTLTGNDSILNVTLNGKNYIPKDSLDSSNLPAWEFVFDKYASKETQGRDKTSTPPSKIIGRTAFAPIPHTGQINLSYALRGNPALATTPIKNKRNWQTRVGVDIRELDLSQITGNFPQADLDSAATLFESENYTGKSQLNQYGLPSPSAQVEDYVDLPAVFVTLSLTDPQKQWVRNWFSASGYNEAEVYAVDPAGNSSSEELSDSTQFYHRFNLPRKSSEDNSSDWNTGLGAGANSDAAVLRLLGSDLQFQLQDDDTIKTNAIPFLRMIGENGGAYPNKEIRRKQIAANLLDYSDSDDIPTSNQPNGTWWNNAPDYAGNEKTPYINEVTAKLTATVEWVAGPDDSSGNPTASVSGNVTLDSVGVELINLYDITFNNLKAKLSGSVNVEISIAGNEPTSATLQFTDTECAIASIGTSPRYASSAANVGAVHDIAPINLPVPLPTDVTADISIKSITIDKMMLAYGSDNVDFVQKLEESGLASATILAGNLSAAAPLLESGYAVGFSVDDPRANLYQTGEAGNNWEYRHSDTNLPAGSVALDLLAGTFTFDAPNSNHSDTLGDREALGTTTVSSAFIANRPMASPMELGAIHRGGKWETINLSNAQKFAAPWDYNISFDYKADVGTTYEQGDGGILNQIKMTDKVYSPGKVNINQDNDTTSARFDIYKALVSNVGVENATYDCADETKLGTRLTNVDSIATNIAPYGKSKPFLSRAQLLEHNTGADGLFNGYGTIPVDTKAEKDALAGKIISLITTRPMPQDTYQFVIVAQSIKDLGDGLELFKLGKENTPVETHTPLSFGVFDQNSAEGVYFDEITGDVKVLVTLKFDQTTKKITLQGFEYID